MHAQRGSRAKPVKDGVSLKRVLHEGGRCMGQRPNDCYRLKLWLFTCSAVIVRFERHIVEFGIDSLQLPLCIDRELFS
jgi:hypothetical protein